MTLKSEGRKILGKGTQGRRLKLTAFVGRQEDLVLRQGVIEGFSKPRGKSCEAFRVGTADREMGEFRNHSLHPVENELVLELFDLSILVRRRGFESCLLFLGRFGQLRRKLLDPMGKDCSDGVDAAHGSQLRSRRTGTAALVEENLQIVRFEPFGKSAGKP